MSSSSHTRPTLPPIRDLFREELSQSSRTQHESPSLTLARLRVSDDPDDYVSPSAPRSQGPAIGPGFNAKSLESRSPGGPQAIPLAPPSRGGPHVHSKPRGSAEQHHGCATPRSISYDAVVKPAPVHPAQLYSSYYHSVPGYYHQTNTSRSSGSLRGLVPSYPPGSAVFPAPSGYHSYPQAITTNSLERVTSLEDDERTPVARQRYSVFPESASSLKLNYPVPEEEANGSPNSKYVCSYCGKGFNRPSSLKIHLNSHTGEKPFICPVESCGRSFSVLSNMRRHARVHTQNPLKHEPSGDEGGSSTQFDHPTVPSAQWHRRRSSSASGSSTTSSRRSRSVSSDDDVIESDGRPEKRSRHHHGRSSINGRVYDDNIHATV